ncbi:MAG: translocation/assembly module TamB domain-containing protein [Solitalea-like symbiont of Acarus siro]
MIKANFKQLSFNETHSRLLINDFKANFIFNKERLELTNLLIKTPNTTIKNKIKLLWTNLSNIYNNIKNLFIDASLVNSKIYISDILKFAPNLRSNDIIKSLTNETIYINTKFKGKAKDLSIDSADISIDKNFYASIRGRGLNLTNSSKMIVDLAIHKLHISSNKLITILSKYTNINKFKSILKQAKFINVKGKIKGTLTKLNMDLSTNTAILNASTTGYINLDSKNYLDIKTNITTQNSNLILNALNTKGIQDQYKIPKKLRIKAHIKGTLNNFYTTTELISNQGSIALTGNIKKRSGIFYYNTDVNINKLDIGYFLMDKDLVGKATGTLNIQGHSFDYKYIQANFKANFKNLQLKNYNYNDISINGSINKKLIRLTADINDPNLQAHIDTATINNRNQNLSVKGDINLYYANLKNLDIVKDDLIVSSHLKVDFPTLNKENINGQLLVTDFIFARDTGSDIIDSVKIDAYSQGLSKQFSIESEFLNAQLTGKFKISQIGNSIKYVLATHLNNIINYSIPGPEDQSFKLDVQIHKARAISLLIPKLEDFQDANINAELHTLDRMLTLNVNLPLIEYGDISVNKLSIKANINPTEAKYNTYVEQLKYNDNSLNKLALDGTLDNNILKNSFIILNDNKQEDYSIKFDAAIANNQVDIHFHPDIILDKYQWHIKNDNKIILNKSKIAIHNFELSNQKSMLKIANTNDLINDQLEISFKDFNIKTISKIVREEKNGELISGIINGNLTINSLKNNPTFSSNIKIESLNIKNQLLGNLNLQAQEAEKIIDVKDKINGNNNDVNIVGNYNTKDQTIDFNIQTKKINLDAVEKLSNQEIQDLSGDLSAAININGTTSNPEIKGAISFQNMSFKIRYLNTAFIIQNEKLNIGETINIENFNILDTEKNKATINGSITLLKDFSDILAELTINTDNFKIFGNQNLKDQKELFYGPVYITSNTKLNKTKQATNIKSKVWIAEKTSLNIIMPNKTANIDNREGIVIFKSQHLEKKQDLMEERLHKEHQKTAKKSQKKLKLNIDATINISEASDLRIILDKNGDELVAKGEATLTMSMQNSSDPIITGRYIISEGYYKLSIQDFLTKKFVLEKDGFIAWGGKVENADLNISAKHTVNAAPLPLVNGMTQNLSDEERNKFREKLPFEIQINIVGKLLQPTISFKLDLDDSAKTKDAGTTTEIRLKQINIRESELNKQVISLLAFKRFMEDDPFDSLNNMDADLDIKARNTLGNVLTNQLNDLAGNAIKGIGINFGFNSKKSYETGFADTQSNLDINVKKQLFNNRLTITVGKSLALEGKDMQTKNANNLINNLSLEYALSRNRHYRILFYTTTLDYNPLQTDVRETGLNFVMYRNYNRLNHLFRKHKKETKTNKNKKNQTNDTKPK